MRLRVLAFAFSGFVSAFPVAAQDADEIAVVMALFEELQQSSFDKRREYCGFIGYDNTGKLVASKPTPGTHASCSHDAPDDLAILSSYHTHGDFDHGYFNELPSLADMESDHAWNVNGWIATPGGRLWYVDSRKMEARQICGVGCLPIAPRFYKSQSGDIAERYTYDDLRIRLGQ